MGILLKGLRKRPSFLPLVAKQLQRLFFLKLRQKSPEGPDLPDLRDSSPPALLGRSFGNLLPALPLLFLAPLVRLDNGVCRCEGQNLADPQLHRLLHNQIHLVTLRQRHAERDRKRRLAFHRTRTKNPQPYLRPSCLFDLTGVFGVEKIADRDFFSGLHAQNSGYVPGVLSL